jgi:hypothetical protein
VNATRLCVFPADFHCVAHLACRFHQLHRQHISYSALLYYR